MTVQVTFHPGPRLKVASTQYIRGELYQERYNNGWALLRIMAMHLFLPGIFAKRKIRESVYCNIVLFHELTLRHAFRKLRPKSLALQIDKAYSMVGMICKP